MNHVLITRERTVRISAPPGLVFDLLADISQWPAVMPAVSAARKIAGDVDTEVVEVTAELTGDTDITWRSRRHLDSEGGRVQFARLEPAPPVRAMWGEWVVSDSGGAVALTLTHSCELEDDAQRSVYEAAMESNGRRDLEAVRQECERRAHGATAIG